MWYALVLMPRETRSGGGKYPCCTEPCGSLRTFEPEQTRYVSGAHASVARQRFIQSGSVARCTGCFAEVMVATSFPPCSAELVNNPHSAFELVAGVRVNKVDDAARSAGVFHQVDFLVRVEPVQAVLDERLQQHAALGAIHSSGGPQSSGSAE